MGKFRVGNILKFDSTSGNLMQPVFYSQNTLIRGPPESQKQADQTSLPRELFLLAAINDQFLLTQKLIQNQFRLSEQLKKQKQSSDSGQSSLPNANALNNRREAEEEEDFKFASEKNDDDSMSEKSGRGREREPLTRLRIKKVFKYDVDSDSEGVRKQSKRCETKNIIKNFIKSIFNYLKKQTPYLLQVLSAHRTPLESFLASLQPLNGKINTIVQLREFWTSHPYSPIFRIISAYFLRRYSLRHIFHSRIANHQIHLKYRQKLLASVGRPWEFTSLKDF